MDSGPGITCTSSVPTFLSSHFAKIMVKSNLARLKINSIVKAFIFAEMLLWSGWNFIMPIFAIYVAKLPQGNVEKAASSVSFYLLARVISGLISGRYLAGKRNRHKLYLTVTGMALLGLTYIGMAFSKNAVEIIFYYTLAGLALGIASPAKNSLFATNLNKDKATFTWGILDGGVFLSMAVTAALGGFVAQKYGFQILFFIAAVLNFAALIPYFLYYDYWKKRFKFQPSQTVSS